MQIFKKKSSSCIDLSMPEAWGELDDERLLTVFRLIALNLSSPEIKAICLLKWNKIKILGKTNKKGEFWAKIGKWVFTLQEKTLYGLTFPMDFIDEIPPYPVRVTEVGGRKAPPEDFEGVPFEKYLICDNLFQGYLHTQNAELLKDLLQVIYDLEDVDKVKDIDACAVMAFYWFASLKAMFTKMFCHFYMPIENVSEGDMLQGQSLHQKLTAAVNSQIRALTGGDVTKEPYVMKMDTLRALTELDAKAKEADEYNKRK